MLLENSEKSDFIGWDSRKLNDGNYKFCYGAFLRHSQSRGISFSLKLHFWDFVSHRVKENWSIHKNNQLNTVYNQLFQAFKNFYEVHMHEMS